MSSELDQRLEGLLLEVPEPGSEVGERALERALAALPPPARRQRRRLRAALVLAAVALGLLALAAGSLAAAGALHVSLGRTNRQVAKPLSLPSGAAGITAVVGRRLSVVTRSGFRLQGLPVSTAALSPHALYVAAGIGDSLVALEPDGSHAWSHTTAGPVVAISWAPFGNRIAYVVQVGRHFALHVIWGNGVDDVVVDRSVRAVRPSWRADSLAFAYVGVGGRAIVYDLAHQTRRVIRRAAAGEVRLVAFAPRGSALALVTPSQVVLGRWALDPGAHVVGIGWIGDRLLVAGRSVLALYQRNAGKPLETARVSGRVLALATAGSRIAVAVSQAGSNRILVTTPGRLRHRAFTTVLSQSPRRLLLPVQLG